MAAEYTFESALRLYDNSKRQILDTIAPQEPDRQIKLIKLVGHAILNKEDVPKDAAEDGFLTGGLYSVKIAAMIAKLYYLRPLRGVGGPGIVGKTHIVEKYFNKELPEIIAKEIPKLPKELKKPTLIDHQSAYGPSFDTDLGLKYIFVDAGKGPKDFLGNSAVHVTYTSPTNLSDSATLATTTMKQYFLYGGIQTIATQKNTIAAVLTFL